jgi:hypothetical protein
MQQGTGSIAGLYRAQVESAQGLTAASIEGFERMQQLTLQAWREQLDNQFRIANEISSRSAEAIVDPEIARPAFERLIEVQRQMTDTVVGTNQRLLSAFTQTARNSVELGAQGDAADEGKTVGDMYTGMFQVTLQQWQELANRVLDLIQQQYVTAIAELERQGEQAAERTFRDTESTVRGAEQPPRTPAESARGEGGQTRERKPEMA